MQEELLTTEQALAHLGLTSSRTLRMWRQTRNLPHVTGPDGRPRYRAADLDRARDGLPPLGAVALESLPEAAPADREAARLESEVLWLRSRLEHAEQAAEQYRVLLVAAQQERLVLAQQVAEAYRRVEALQQPPALPPAPRKRWWNPWRTE